MPTEIEKLKTQQNELAEALRWARYWVDNYSMEEEIDRVLANLYSEPERKKDNDMTHDYDRNIHTNPDHEAWADFFIQTWPNGCADRDTMAGWFANAMMAKADSTISEKTEQPAVPKNIRDLLLAHRWRTVYIGSKKYKLDVVLDPNQYEDLQDQINAAPQPPADRWVPCSERLPKNGQLVVASYAGVYDYRVVTFWNGGRFGTPDESDGMGAQPATHWIPLPDLPQQGGREK